MTLTEVLRLSLMTSGYYTGAPTHRFRLFSRGAIRCYEDEGFLFAKDNPQTMSILEKVVHLYSSFFNLRTINLVLF